MKPRKILHRCRRTRIVATIGPSSSTADMLTALHQAGADVFRLNFSHGSHDDHAGRIKLIRALEEQSGRPIGILADVQGPKLRVGKFSGGRVLLQKGQLFRLDLDATPGDAQRVALPHPEIIDAMQIGSSLLLDDGKLRMRVVTHQADHLICEVTVGGTLSDRKGVNVPDVVLNMPALTAKDRLDLAFAVEKGLDFIGLSFVQRPEDVAEARELTNGRIWIMSKIEKPQALKELDAILDLSDAVMVARGDLGVELPPEEVPLEQKRVVREARRRGLPVVVATQMLESMISSPAPTRAEASDVATAVFDGADAVMLSAETAAGNYPLEAVSIMDRIITRTEQDEGWRALMDRSRFAPVRTTPDAIAAAAGQVAHTLGAKVICALTSSGSTAQRVARVRPDAPILCMTPSQQTARRMALVWGVHATVFQGAASMTEAVEAAMKASLNEGFAKSGEEIVVVAGVPFGRPGTTNALRVADLK